MSCEWPRDSRWNVRPVPSSLSWKLSPERNGGTCPRRRRAATRHVIPACDRNARIKQARYCIAVGRVAARRGAVSKRLRSRVMPIPAYHRLVRASKTIGLF